MIASTLPEPSSVSAANPERPLRPDFKEPQPRESSSDHAEVLEGFENEDYQLQAALQASLMDGSLDQPSFSPPRYIPNLQPTINSSSSTSGSARPDSGSLTPRSMHHIGGSMSSPGHEDVDPIAASAERNRLLLQRMKEEQEYAQREVWSGADLTPEEHIALQARREQRQREEQEEAEDMRKAIEKSRALAQRSQLEVDEDIEIDDENHDMDAESPYPHKSFVPGNRVYDDDDAELQAALKASLEHMPPNVASQLPKSSSDAEDTESIVSDTTSAAEEPTSNVTPAVSLDEIRRRRLARFGVQS
jgi:ataxin-3